MEEKHQHRVFFFLPQMPPCGKPVCTARRSLPALCPIPHPPIAWTEQCGPCCASADRLQMTYSCPYSKGLVSLEAETCQGLSDCCGRSRERLAGSWLLREHWDAYQMPVANPDFSFASSVVPMGTRSLLLLCTEFCLRFGSSC